MRNTISVSQTNWLTEKKQDIFFIHRASEILTRRDDAKATIKGNMTLPEHFGLFPQQKTVYIEGKKVVYRALMIDVLETRMDDVKDKITDAFIEEIQD